MVAPKARAILVWRHSFSDHYISRSLSVSSSAYYYSLLHYLIVGIYVIFLHSDDDEPCIGLCYYKKILEEEQNKMERDQVLYHHLDSRAQSPEDPRDTPYVSKTSFFTQASTEEDDVPSSTLNPSISSATSPKGMFLSPCNIAFH